MTATRNLNGSYTISDIIDNHCKSITYYGYTKREAIKRYKQATRNQDAIDFLIKNDQSVLIKSYVKQGNSNGIQKQQGNNYEEND